MPVKPYHHPRTKKPGWQILVYLKLDDGRKIRKSKIRYGITFTQAQKIHDIWKAKLINQMEGSFLPDRTDPSLRDILDGYIEYGKSAGLDWKNMTYRASPIKAFFPQGRPAKSILPDDLVKYMAHRRKQTTMQGRRMSPTTVDTEIRFIRAAYNHASRNMILIPPYNPAQFVRLARIPNKRERVLQDDELETVLRALPGELERMIFFWARFTGIRKTQLLSIDWSQLRDGLVMPPEFDPGKSLYRSCKGFGLIPSIKGLPMPESSHGGRLWLRGGKTIKDVRSVLERVRNDTGIDFWFHDLRRTYATHLRKIGVSREVRKTILGHSLESEIHDRYQVVSMQEIRAVGKKLEKDSSFKRLLGVYLSCKNSANR